MNSRRSTNFPKHRSSFKPNSWEYRILRFGKDFDLPRPIYQLCQVFADEHGNPFKARLATLDQLTLPAMKKHLKAVAAAVEHPPLAASSIRELHTENDAYFRDFEFPNLTEHEADLLVSLLRTAWLSADQEIPFEEYIQHIFQKDGIELENYRKPNPETES